MLPIIAYFQYQKWTKFNPPNSYDYVVSDSIDIGFYDPLILKEYYTSAFEIGSFARRHWYNEGIDVRFPGENPHDLEVANHYNRLVAVTKQIEDRLKISFQLKGEGYTNIEIKQMFENGWTAQHYEAFKAQEYLSNTNFGDINKNVWKLQQRLNEKGFETIVDGNYRIDTRVKLMEFQSENDLFPSGQLDEDTYNLLFN